VPRGDVFISYTQPDSDVAHELVSQLEARGIKCWIAPRDIPPGADWAREIVDAIAAARVMVLVFSVSTRLTGQLTFALDRGMRVVGFRIDDVEPPAILSGHHWLDAFPPPRDRHYESLCTCLNNILATDPFAALVAGPHPGKMGRPATGPHPGLPPPAATSRPELDTPVDCAAGAPLVLSDKKTQSRKERWKAQQFIGADPDPTHISRIQMTVFGPAQVTRRERFFLQTIFHAAWADDAALARARVAEPRPAVADVLPLAGRISEGETVTVRVRADARVNLDECEQTLPWTRDIAVARFVVQLPWWSWRQEYLFTVEVDFSGVPVGRCKFRLTVGKRGVDTEPTHAHGTLGRYQRAFVSYASEDASIVADVVQLLEVQGLEYFLDQVSLRSGCTWRTELEENIEKSDLFLLCWSRNAAASEWVAKEIDWALQTQRRTGGLRPDIRPFILEGPPIAPPPRSLQHLHFNSATRLFKQSVGASR
jgi:TIR domain